VDFDAVKKKQFEEDGKWRQRNELAKVQLGELVAYLKSNLKSEFLIKPRYASDFDTMYILEDALGQKLTNRPSPKSTNVHYCPKATK